MPAVFLAVADAQQYNASKRFARLLAVPQFIMSQIPVQCIRLSRTLLPRLAAALLTIATANNALALSFAPAPTVGDLVSRSNVVALGKILRQDRKSDPRTTTFELLGVDRGPMTVYRGLKVTQRRKDGIPGQQFMLYGKASEDPGRKEQSTSKESVEALRKLGARVFLRNDKVVEVSANRTKISDDDLKYLAEFADLTDLSLEETNISSAGMAHLSKLQKLEWLNLYRTKVGDEGVGHLKNLKRLKLLPIGDAGITDAGLVHLQGMTQLEYLGLRGNKVTDMGLASLVKLVNLTGLYLGETKVTSAGLVHLERMAKLEKLWLNDTAISDAAIPTLSKLKSLRELYVYDTKLTPRGIAALRKNLPKCQITERSTED